MTQISNLVEAERVLMSYVPQVKELLGKDLTLQRMQPMLETLGNPQDQLRIIHVAGTSGKTSTTYYIASLLAHTGKRVGHTVSPHIDSITERVQIDLQPLAESEFCSALEEFLELIKDVEPRPTYFELLIGFVYWYFAKVGVDYAVIETGLGGRFDATNVVSRQDKVCVITDIGMDHQHVLGNTLPEIAAQKAGIILPANQVFMHQQSPMIVKVFQEEASRQHATLNVLSNEQQARGEFDTLPQFQQRNWLLAKAVYGYIAERDSLPNQKQELLTQAMQIQVPGRMDTQRVGSKTVIMDGAHNEQKMSAFVKSFQKRYPGQKVPVLLSLKQGKEYQAVLPLLIDIASNLIITTFDTVQDTPIVSSDPRMLAAEAKKAGFQHILVESDAMKAYQLALQSTQDICVITGSFYLLSCLRPAILGTDD